MLGNEIPPLAGACYLVCLLVVLASVIGVRRLGREGVVRHPFQVIGPLEVCSGLEHFLERIHHLHCGAELRSACRVAEMHLLVAGPQTCRETECVPHYLQGVLRSVQVLLVVRPLPPDHRLLEAVSQVYRVHRILDSEFVGLAPEHRCPRGRLAVDQVAEFKKEFVSCDVVEPIYHVKVVTTSPFSPECPVVERLLRKVGKLILEVVGHHGDDALVACCHVILLEDLQGHHLRPPVLGLSALESFYVFTRYPVAEVSVLEGHGEHRLRPDS